MFQDWNNLQPEILDIIDTNTFSNMIKWSVPADHPRYVPWGYCGELYVDVDGNGG